MIRQRQQQQQTTDGKNLEQFTRHFPDATFVETTSLCPVCQGAPGPCKTCNGYGVVHQVASSTTGFGHVIRGWVTRMSR
ncbi:MAG: hypothetical protein ACFB14_10900 [Leptolyngbyaceae cyanobacterium]